MLQAIKYFIKLISIPIFYVGGLITAFVTIMRDAKWGLLLLIYFIPQPNIWYKLHAYPMGNSTIDILFFSVILGILIQNKTFEIGSNGKLIILFIVVSYFQLWNSSLRFSIPLPITTTNELLRDWKNYAEMAFLYLLVINVAKDENKQKTIIILIAVVILFISIRSYRNFSAGDAFRYDKRYGGPFEACGLGSNHLGAFIAYTASLYYGLVLFENNSRNKILYGATVLFALHPLFFSYSRGAYLAALGSIALFSLMHKRKLIILVVIILLAWQTILPVSVVDRIMMTSNQEGEIEHSAAMRLELWDFAMKTFRENPVFGVGFGGFSLSVGGHTLSTGETVPAGFDSHNYWVKLLCEQGVIGFALFLTLLFAASRSGWRLFIHGKSEFHRGLGLGFMGSVLAMMITNLFGDRWSYFAVGGYFWVFWGLVDRGIILSGDSKFLGSTLARLNGQGIMAQHDDTVQVTAAPLTAQI